MIPVNTPFASVAADNWRYRGRKISDMAKNAMPNRRAIRLYGPMPSSPIFIRR